MLWGAPRSSFPQGPSEFLDPLFSAIFLSGPVASSHPSQCRRRGTRYNRADSQQRLITLNQHLGTEGTLGRAVSHSWSPVTASTSSVQRSVHSQPGSGEWRGWISEGHSVALSCLRTLTLCLVFLKDVGICFPISPLAGCRTGYQQPRGQFESILNPHLGPPIATHSRAFKQVPSTNALHERCPRASVRHMHV